MTDQELAEKIIAFGVGFPSHSVVATRYLVPDKSARLAPDEFVRDPRVAMAMMEKALQKGSVHIAPYEGTLDGSYTTYEVRVSAGAFTTRTLALSKPDESLPRAINEACAEALSND